jgi:glycerol-3-phosphate acyltransferase PlsY
MTKIVLFCVIAYLLGSIPNGYIICKKFYHIDITKYGSKNIGVTNVQRVVGNKAAIAVFLLDFGKGFLAVMIGKYFLQVPSLAMLLGIMAIIGHDYSLFMPHFKGGKGVATTYGVIGAISVYAGLLSGSIFFLVLLLTKYVSLASIVSICSLPVFLTLLHVDKTIILSSLIIALLVKISHRENIKRLLKGNERKIGEKIKTDKDKN